MPIKNFERPIKEPDGTTYTEPKPSKESSPDGRALLEVIDGKVIRVEISFGTVINNILKNKATNKDNRQSSDEFIEQWNLMQKIAGGGDIELSGTQIDIIRKLITESGIPPFMIGQICAYLNEGEPVKKLKK